MSVIVRYIHVSKVILTNNTDVFFSYDSVLVDVSAMHHFFGGEVTYVKILAHLMSLLR